MLAMAKLLYKYYCDFLKFEYKQLLHLCSVGQNYQAQYIF